MSEDAQRRSQAARWVRRFPALLDNAHYEKSGVHCPPPRATRASADGAKSRAHCPPPRATRASAHRAKPRAPSAGAHRPPPRATRAGADGAKSGAHRPPPEQPAPARIARSRERPARERTARHPGQPAPARGPRRTEAPREQSLHPGARPRGGLGTGWRTLRLRRRSRTALPRTRWARAPPLRRLRSRRPRNIRKPEAALPRTHKALAAEHDFGPEHMARPREPGPV